MNATNATNVTTGTATAGTQLPATMEPRSLTKHDQRLLSVDLLRGLTIAFMILVNDPGDSRVGYAALTHADWNGFTPTDLVFPTFLFLVGVSLVLSHTRREADGIARGAFLWHALRRTLLLFALGVLLNGFPLYPWRTLRIYGVLQRIAVCFGIGSLLLAFTRHRKRRILIFSTVLVAVLLGYWLILRFTPVPGHGLPVRDFPLLDKDVNPVAWLDRKLLPGRLYEHTRDPEGLLSTLPAVGTLILGMLTGFWLSGMQSARRKAAGLVAAALGALLLGGLWNFILPINKKLWTSSYVLWAGGWSLLILALFFWLCDVKNWRGPGSHGTDGRSRGWTPLLVFGKNAIASYVFAELLAGCGYFIRIHGQPLSRVVYQRVFAGSGSPAFGSMLFSLFFVAVCWAPMALLYRRGVFLKL